MSATYNWVYKPGVVNKYGFVIPAGADDVKPAGWCYIALFGNDSTGNGSRQKPYRTITYARNVGNQSDYYVIGSGVYRESGIGTLYNLIGDGDVVIDISYFTDTHVFATSYTPRTGMYNLKFLGDGIQRLTNDENGTSYTIIDCLFNGLHPTNRNGGGVLIFTNVVLSNLSNFVLSSDAPSGNITNCTFINIKNLSWYGKSAFLTSCILMNCNINIYGTLTSFVRYSMLYNCNFRFGSNNGGGNLFPSVPTGYSYLTSIPAINAALSSAFPLSLLFVNCVYADPKFNNFDIGDYTLAFDSPAKNLSYFGTYVGARSIAYPVKVSGTESTGAFEFASAINLTISDDSIVLTNTALDAQIDTKVIVNTLGREIANLPSYGFNADRNGQYIDSIADLSNSTRSAGDTLVIPAPYLVENGTIAYNGSTYTAGLRLTTVTGQTTFTTSTGGVLREILEAPQRHTILARFSDVGAVITSADGLTTGYYYYVQTGSVTYNSVTYNQGSVFKALDTNSFSGSGAVILALSTESFQHYEPGAKPTTNNVGDSRTGVIIRGNGDPAYVRGGTGVTEFYITAKFIQIRYMIRVANLRP